jgi:PPK2 family polyphosphate:nucleotide phosphotransferase
MKPDINAFRVREGTKVRLTEWPTRVKPFYNSKKHYEEMQADHIARLSALQSLLWADNRHALLLIFQAMDAAGKDSAIKHVMSGINPQGCQVFSFKAPSAQELSHDFLWRTTNCLPERGSIGIFNRSYYEEVLIVRVHPEILLSQGLPVEVLNDGDIWQQRYLSIVNQEKHLHHNGTRVVKFFLHLSKEEQRRRFLARIEDPDKNWKFSQADIKERDFWKDYMRAYADCLGATSTRDAPWYVVPADDKKNARLIISQVIAAALEDLKLSYPKPGKAHREELEAARRVLTK